MFSQNGSRWILYYGILSLFYFGIALVPVRAEEAPGPGGPGGPPQLSAAERKAMDTCLSAKGVTVPKPPEPTDAQKAIFQKCDDSSDGDGAEYHECLKENGITPPARPNFTDAQKTALKQCHDQVVGKSSSPE